MGSDTYTTRQAIDALYEAAEKCIAANMEPRTALDTLREGWRHRLHEKQEEDTKVFDKFLKEKA